MNMFKPVKAKTVAAYIAAAPLKQKPIVKALHQLIRKTVPTLKPYFADNMIGYGSFAYRNYKKEDIRWPVIALAYQKKYISIYVCSVINGAYVAEQYAERLGGVTVGRSCIRLVSVEDINLPILRKVLILAARHPGLAK